MENEIVCLKCIQLSKRVQEEKIKNNKKKNLINLFKELLYSHDIKLSDFSRQNSRDLYNRYMVDGEHVRQRLSATLSSLKEVTKAYTESVRTNEDLQKKVDDLEAKQNHLEFLNKQLSEYYNQVESVTVTKNKKQKVESKNQKQKKELKKNNRKLNLKIEIKSDPSSPNNERIDNSLSNFDCATENSVKYEENEKEQHQQKSNSTEAVDIDLSLNVSDYAIVEKELFQAKNFLDTLSDGCESLQDCFDVSDEDDFKLLNNSLSDNYFTIDQHNSTDQLNLSLNNYDVVATEDDSSSKLNGNSPQDNIPVKKYESSKSPTDSGLFSSDSSPENVIYEINLKQNVNNVKEFNSQKSNEYSPEEEHLKTNGMKDVTNVEKENISVKNQLPLCNEDINLKLSKGKINVAQIMENNVSPDVIFPIEKSTKKQELVRIRGTKTKNRKINENTSVFKEQEFCKQTHSNSVNESSQIISKSFDNNSSISINDSNNENESLFSHVNEKSADNRKENEGTFVSSSSVLVQETAMKEQNEQQMKFSVQRCFFPKPKLYVPLLNQTTSPSVWSSADFNLNWTETLKVQESNNVDWNIFINGFKRMKLDSNDENKKESNSSQNSLFKSLTSEGLVTSTQASRRTFNRIKSKTNWHIFGNVSNKNNQDPPFHETFSDFSNINNNLDTNINKLKNGEPQLSCPTDSGFSDCSSFYEYRIHDDEDTQHLKCQQIKHKIRSKSTSVTVTYKLLSKECGYPYQIFKFTLDHPIVRINGLKDICIHVYSMNDLIYKIRNLTYELEKYYDAYASKLCGNEIPFNHWGEIGSFSELADYNRLGIPTPREMSDRDVYKSCFNYTNDIDLSFTKPSFLDKCQRCRKTGCNFNCQTLCGGCNASCCNPYRINPVWGQDSVNNNEKQNGIYHTDKYKNISSSPSNLFSNVKENYFFQHINPSKDSSNVSKMSMQPIFNETNSLENLNVNNSEDNTTVDTQLNSDRRHDKFIFQSIISPSNSFRNGKVAKKNVSQLKEMENELNVIGKETKHSSNQKQQSKNKNDEKRNKFDSNSPSNNFISNKPVENKPKSTVIKNVSGTKEKKYGEVQNDGCKITPSTRMNCIESSPKVKENTSSEKNAIEEEIKTIFTIPSDNIKNNSRQIKEKYVLSKNSTISRVFSSKNHNIETKIGKKKSNRESLECNVAVNTSKSVETQLSSSEEHNSDLRQNSKISAFKETERKNLNSSFVSNNNFKENSISYNDRIPSEKTPIKRNKTILQKLIKTQNIRDKLSTKVESNSDISNNDVQLTNNSSISVTSLKRNSVNKTKLILEKNKNEKKLPNSVNEYTTVDDSKCAGGMNKNTFLKECSKQMKQNFVSSQKERGELELKKESQERKVKFADDQLKGAEMKSINKLGPNSADDLKTACDRYLPDIAAINSIMEEELKLVEPISPLPQTDSEEEYDRSKTLEKLAIDNDLMETSSDEIKKDPPACTVLNVEKSAHLQNVTETKGTLNSITSKNITANSDQCRVSNTGNLLNSSPKKEVIPVGKQYFKTDIVDCTKLNKEKLSRLENNRSQKPSITVPNSIGNIKQGTESISKNYCKELKSNDDSFTELICTTTEFNENECTDGSKIDITKINNVPAYDAKCSNMLNPPKLEDSSVEIVSSFPNHTGEQKQYSIVDKTSIETKKKENRAIVQEIYSSSTKRIEKHLWNIDKLEMQDEELKSNPILNSSECVQSTTKMCNDICNGVTNNYNKNNETTEVVKNKNNIFVQNDNSNIRNRLRPRRESCSYNPALVNKEKLIKKMSPKSMKHSNQIELGTCEDIDNQVSPSIVCNVENKELIMNEIQVHKKCEDEHRLCEIYSEFDSLFSVDYKSSSEIANEIEISDQSEIVEDVTDSELNGTVVASTVIETNTSVISKNSSSIGNNENEVVNCCLNVGFYRDISEDEQKKTTTVNDNISKNIDILNLCNVDPNSGNHSLTQDEGNILKVQHIDCKTDGNVPLTGENRGEKRKRSINDCNVLSKIPRTVSRSEIIECKEESAMRCTLCYIKEKVLQDNNLPIGLRKKKKNDSVNKVVKSLIDSFVATTAEKGNKLKAIVNDLNTYEIKQIANVILEVVVGDKQVMKTPIAVNRMPPLTQIQKRLLMLTMSLAQFDGSVYDEVLHSFEESLASFRDKSINVVNGCRMIFFYTVLCRSQGFLSRARSLLLDLLYSRHKKAFPIVLKMITIWPFVIPHASFSKGCLLTAVILHILRMPYVGPDKIAMQESMNLKKNLLTKYAFPDVEESRLTRDELFREILSRITERGNGLALLLLSKFEGNCWASTKVQNALIPLLQKWLHSEKTSSGNRNDNAAAEIALALGRIVRGFPKLSGRTLINNSINIFEHMLNETNNFVVMEAVVEALVLLRRHNLPMCATALARWHPKGNEITIKVAELIRSVLSVKPLTHWLRFLASKSC